MTTLQTPARRLFNKFFFSFFKILEILLLSKSDPAKLRTPAVGSLTGKARLGAGTRPVRLAKWHRKRRAPRRPEDPASACLTWFDWFGRRLRHLASWSGDSQRPQREKPTGRPVSLHCGRPQSFFLCDWQTQRLQGPAPRLGCARNGRGQSGRAQRSAPARPAPPAAGALPGARRADEEVAAGSPRANWLPGWQLRRGSERGAARTAAGPAATGRGRCRHAPGQVWPRAPATEGGRSLAGARARPRSPEPRLSPAPSRTAAGRSVGPGWAGAPSGAAPTWPASYLGGARGKAVGSGGSAPGAHLSVASAALPRETRAGASVTNGGKTTLAKRLQKHLPNCSIISQDDFFKPESEIETDKNGFLQYDVLEALNMEKMMSAVSCWMENPRHTQQSTDRNEEISILIIEGFLLFNYKPFDPIWNRSYFLTVPYEECKRRRSTRVYEPPDPPGYFDGHVWPMYLKHRREMEDIAWEVVYLDGTKSEEDLFSQVYEDLIQELAKQKCLQVTA
uniref:Nicotinamide riboside kinase 1 n=1 Tax=Oryctolagus cuniculus TaxID=9986 RepID=G1TCV3_RABIT|nr:nicotinamide riboside kinase 1 isoform X1 [Oryctolagus cuniculus]